MGEESATVRETDDLCREIASTRRRLEERADALRDRMTAKELIRPVTDRLKDTLGAGGEKILEAFRDNPVPLTLVGIGLGWLMLKDGGYLYRGRGGGSRLRSMSRDAREAAQTVGEAAGAVSEKVSNMAEQTREAAHQARESVRRGAAHTADWFSRTLEENPLSLAIGALAAGLVAGLAIPVTEKEQEALGKIGEQMAQKVLERAPEGAQPAAGENPGTEAPAVESKSVGEEGVAPASPAGQGTNPGMEPHFG